MADSRFLRLVKNYSAQRGAVSDRVERQVNSVWARTDPYNGQSVKDFVEEASLFMTAGQQQVAFQIAAVQRTAFDLLGVEGMEDYIPNVPDEVRLYSDEGYEFADPVSVRTDLGFSQRLPADEVFNRPVRKYRYLRSVGKSHSESLDESNNRVKIIVETNLALAQREAETQIIQATKKRGKGEKVTGYRRIIHPERSRTGVCGLCIAAADRIYQVEQLKDLHTYCQCTVLPVTAANDPGLDLNQEDLEQLYGPDGRTASEYLRQLSFKVEQHGELGPILVPTASSKGGGVITFNQQQNDTRTQTRAA
ncbi:capsid maturation protease [Gordonia Phage JonJames]|nr:capsid maturation protease [Gordonia Phage JonJames]